MSVSRVCSLQKLCLRSVVLNIVSHGEMLSNSQDCEELIVLYKRLKYLFWWDLTKELYRIHHGGEDNNNEQLNQLLHFVFCKEESDTIKTTRLGLEFLFNEHTSILNFSSSEHLVITHGLLDFALSRCKNLKIMVLKFYSFKESQWISAMPWRHTLVKVDMLYSYVTDETVMRLLRNCPNLEVFKASGRSITSETLYGLCNDHCTKSWNETSVCRGTCGNIGKKIKVLVLYAVRRFDKVSVACALRHLPSLEVFCDTYYGAYPPFSTICDGISLLRGEASETKALPVSLNLTKLFFRRGLSLKEISNALECCPRLKSFCVEISPDMLKFFTSNSSKTLKSIHLGRYIDLMMSSSFHQFLTVKGWQLETISLNGRGISDEPLDVKYIFIMVGHCKNLKNLFLTGVNVKCDHSADLILNAENNLQKVSLAFVIFKDNASLDFFVNLLSVSLEVKHINLSHNYAKTLLTSAMERNRFSLLERILINDADLENFSLTSLIYSKSCLRNITLVSCENSRAFSNMHSEAARKCGLSLSIDCLKSDIEELLDHRRFLYHE